MLQISTSVSVPVRLGISGCNEKRGEGILKTWAFGRFRVPGVLAATTMLVLVFHTRANKSMRRNISNRNTLGVTDEFVVQHCCAAQSCTARQLSHSLQLY